MLSDRLGNLGFGTGARGRPAWFGRILIGLLLAAVVWMGLSAPTTVIAGRRALDILLLLVMMVFAVILILYRLEFGVIAIVFTSFFIRFSFSTGSATQIPVSLVTSSLVVFVWILSMLLRGRIQLLPGSYVKPVLLFILISLLSVPYSWLLFLPDLFGQGGSGRSGLGFGFVQLGGVTLMVLLPTVMLMTANVLRDEKWFKVLFGIMLVVAVPELLQRIGVFGFGLGSLVIKTGASYSLWIVALSCGQAFFNSSLQRWQRAALLALGGIWLYYGAELGATWFSGWMPAFVAFIFLAFLRSRKLFVAILIAGLFVFLLRPDHYINNIWNDAVNYDSNRFEIWRIIIFDLTLTKTNLLFGAGPAGYLPVYEYYYPGNAWVSHNNYIDIFAEVGLIGFSIFLWLLYAIFRTGWDQRENMPTPFLRGFNYGVLAGFVGTLFAMGLGDWHIPFVYNIGIPGFDFAVYGWLLTGAMLALQHIQREPQHQVPARVAT